MLDDPEAATIYRVSGEPPYPVPGQPSLPPSIQPRHVTLRDRQTVATVVPFASRHQVPDSLLRYLNDQFNKEIDGGDTYPMMEGLPFDKFASYWFQNFGAIMLLGNIESADEVVEGKDWSKECLGTFYIKPNYPGRSSHICNAGFIVTDAARNRGVGRLMGESYLDWAPKLGYTYSVFNLVYETNVASCKIWDALGFKRIGRVKECGNLKSYPGRLIDAIIYGRELGGDASVGDDPVSEERFDKIKFYLKYGRYPSGADRAEKSRLRSAATHYKLVDNVLMLKDKEVIAHPTRQYDIARQYHNVSHAGINKTTATIAERYHWSRIKETVSDVIRNCPECKELGKTSPAPPLPGVSSTSSGNHTFAAVNQVRAGGRSSGNSLGAPSSAFSSSTSSKRRKSRSPSASGSGSMAVDARAAGPWSIPLPESVSLPEFSTLTSHHHHHHHHYPDADPGIVAPSHTLQSSVDVDGGEPDSPMLQDQPHDVVVLRQHHQHTATSALAAIPNSHHQSHHTVSVYHPIDPQIINQPSSGHIHAHLHHDLHHSYSFPQHVADTHTFAALLSDASMSHAGHSHSDGHLSSHHGLQADGSHHHHRSREEEEAAVDRDLEMLIQQPQDDEDEEEQEEERRQAEGREMDVDIDVDDGSMVGDNDAHSGAGRDGTGVMQDGMSSGDGVASAAAAGRRRRSRSSTAAATGKMDLGHLLLSSVDGVTDGGGDELRDRELGIES
jgi:GNAT superfamily N-acetyltransferase